MSVLGLDQRVEILPSGEDLPGIGGAVELARVAANGRHLPLELVADVDHEGGLDRVFAIGEGVQQLEGTKRGSAGGVLREPGEKAGIPRQFRGDPVVGVSADRVGEDDNLGGKMTDRFDHDSPGLVAVVNAGVGESGIPALDDPHDLRSPLGLLRAEGGAAPGGRLAGRQVENPGSITLIGSSNKGPGACQLDVVSMGGDC
jgi:hypothetical protein